MPARTGWRRYISTGIHRRSQRTANLATAAAPTCGTQRLGCEKSCRPQRRYFARAGASNQPRRAACDETLRDITRKYGGVMSVARSSGDASMLTFQLIGAAFVVLCLAPLLARDPS